MIMRSLRFLSAFFGLLFMVQFSFAQDIITFNHSCSFDGEEANEEFYVFNASSEADQIVAQIVNAFSLSKNFIVKSANCKNALATVEGKQRYILYNTSFLEDFKKDANTKWAAYCVLAHEIGHHLNNHDFEVTNNRKRKVMELEADKFAGGVLFILGAELNEAKAGINLLQLKEESATHPPASARAEAIANGWKNSQEHYRSITDGRSTEPSSEEGKQKEEIQPKSNFEGQDKIDNELILKYLRRNNIHAESTSSGIYYFVEDQGSGTTHPNNTSLITAHYECRNLDGTVLDSSIERGEPFQFKLEQVITGWQEAIQLMKKGDKGIFIIPSGLAYGPNGTGANIGPNTVLTFYIELIDFIN